MSRSSRSVDTTLHYRTASYIRTRHFRAASYIRTRVPAVLASFPLSSRFVHIAYTRQAPKKDVRTGAAKSVEVTQGCNRFAGLVFSAANGNRAKAEQHFVGRLSIYHFPRTPCSVLPILPVLEKKTSAGKRWHPCANSTNASLRHY